MPAGRRGDADEGALSPRSKRLVVIASVVPAIVVAVALAILYKQDVASTASSSTSTVRSETAAIVDDEAVAMTATTLDDSDDDAASAAVAMTATTAPNLRSTIAGFGSTTLEVHDSDLSSNADEVIASSTRGTSSSTISTTSSFAAAEIDTHSTNSVSSTGLTSTTPGSLTSPEPASDKNVIQILAEWQENEWILNFHKDGDENDKHFDVAPTSAPSDGTHHPLFAAADTSTNPTTSFGSGIGATVASDEVASTGITVLQISTSSFALPTPSAFAPPSIELDQSKFPHTIPSFRFVEWSRLDSQTREFASQIGYSHVSWNAFNGNPIESKGWTDLTPDERLAAKQLGYTPTSWDCFVNHYRSKSWDDLLLVVSQDSYRELGWNASTWTGVGRAPASERMYWKDLTPNESKAANRLCYYEETWDKVFDMTPNESYFPYPLPMFRLHPWSELSPLVVGWASTMYNETLWNSMNEHQSFDDLSHDERQAALEIGFYEQTWDCYSNHYDSYYWRSIPPNQGIALEALGWTQNSWSESIPSPDSERKDWLELDPLEKAAATTLCYWQETWDELDITEWYDYAAGENTAVSPDNQVPSDIWMDGLMFQRDWRKI